MAEIPGKELIWKEAKLKAKIAGLKIKRFFHSLPVIIIGFLILFGAIAFILIRGSIIIVSALGVLRFVLIIANILFIILLVKAPAIRPLIIFIMVIEIVLLGFSLLMPRTTKFTAETGGYEAKSFIQKMQESILSIFSGVEQVEAGVKTSHRHPEDTGGVYISELKPQGSIGKTLGMPTYLQGDQIIINGFIEGKGFLTNETSTILFCYLKLSNGSTIKGSVTPNTFTIPPRIKTKNAFTCRIPSEGVKEGVHEVVVDAVFNAETVARTYIGLIDSRLTWFSTSGLERLYNQQGTGKLEYNPFGIFFGLANSESWDSGGPAMVSISSSELITASPSTKFDGWISVGIRKRNFYSGERAKGEVLSIDGVEIYLPRSVELVSSNCSQPVNLVNSGGGNGYWNIYSIETKKGRTWDVFNCPININDYSFFRSISKNPEIMNDVIVKMDPQLWAPIKMQEFRARVKYLFKTSKKTAIRIKKNE